MSSGNNKEFLSGLDVVVTRNSFYRDNYYRVLFCVLFMLALNVVLAGMVYHKWANPPMPQYFAATADGRIIKINPLTDPTVPDDFVLQWASNAAHKAFTLDFIHWREQLQDASSNFTADGWGYFLDKLKKSNNLKTIMDLKMVSDAKVTGSPEVVGKSIVGGHYAWNIKIPMLITYTSPTKTINQPLNVTVLVVREPVQYYPQKIAINNIFTEQVGTSMIDNSET